MEIKPFFVKVPSDLLARTDLTSTRKLILAYLILRSGIESWTFNATDISKTLGISYKTAIRELKIMEGNHIIKYVGYTKVLRKSYKKYILTWDKMSKTNLGQNVQTNLGQNVQTNLGQNVQTNLGQNVPLEEVKKEERKKKERKKKENPLITIHAKPSVELEPNQADVFDRVCAAAGISSMVSETARTNSGEELATAVLPNISMTLKPIPREYQLNARNSLQSIPNDTFLP
jgi:hypothetical protein